MSILEKCIDGKLEVRQGAWSLALQCLGEWVHLCIVANFMVHCIVVSLVLMVIVLCKHLHDSWQYAGLQTRSRMALFHCFVSGGSWTELRCSKRVPDCTMLREGPEPLCFIQMGPGLHFMGNICTKHSSIANEP